MVRLSRFACAITLLATFLSTTELALARDLRVIAKVGDAVPIPDPLDPSGVSTVLRPITTLSSGGLTHPVAAANGDAIIEGIVNSQASGNPMAVRAYWLRRANGALESLVYHGMQEPGGMPGNVISNPSIFDFTPGGRVVFYATLSGNAVSYWCKAGGQLLPVLRYNQVIHTPEGDARIVSFTNVDSANRAAFDTANGCGAILRATLVFTANNVQRQSVILRATSETTEVLLAGDGARIFADGPDFTLDSLGFARSNHNGDTLLGVTLAGTGVDASNDRALLFASRSSGLSILAREGSAAPRQSIGPIVSLQWDGNFAVPKLNDSGKVAFRAAFPRQPSGTTVAFWSNRFNDGEIILQEGDPIFGEIATPTFGTGYEYFLLEDGTFAIYANIAGAASNNDGALLANQDGELHAVAREGKAIPGLGGVVIGANAFQTDSFGRVPGSPFVSNVVNGQSEFALSTILSDGSRIILNTFNPANPAVLRTNTAFSPEGDTVTLLPTSIGNMFMDERGGLAMIGTVDRHDATGTHVQSMITVSPSGRADLAYATDDTICIGVDDCRTLTASYVAPQITSVDTTGDLLPDTGRMLVNLGFGNSGVIMSARTGCRADINETGTITVQDIFDYLTRYFGGVADINGRTNTTVQDLFDFLTAYFGGC